jgi:hypothetical protein
MLRRFGQQRCPRDFAAPGEAEDFASDVVPTGGKAAMRSAS